jgi:hypothetical protein
MSYIPAAPAGLRAGQTGIVILGRVAMGDIAATLVDLILRELLTAEETAGGGDWLLAVTGPAAQQGREGLAGYEKRLLEGLGEAGSETRLSSLVGEFGKTLGETRKILIRDAAHRRWIQHLHHDRRTAKGGELAGQVLSFRRDLRRLVARGDQTVLAGTLLPFALRFGLLSQDHAPLVRFAHAWVRTFADVPGWVPPRPARPESGNDQPLFADIGKIPGAGLWWAAG